MARLRWLILTLLVAAALPFTLTAQSTAAMLNGTVSDASGAVVPNADVTLTALETGSVLKVTTGRRWSLLIPATSAGSL